MHRSSILPFLVLMLLAVGCGRLQSGSRGADASSPSPTPQIVKVVDVPAIFGKSVEEVKKAVTGGKITYESKDSIWYEFPQGNLSVDARASTGKSLIFYLKDNASGKSYDLAAESPQQVANFAGIDLAGMTQLYSSDFAVAYEGRFGGVGVEIIFLRKGSGQNKFDSLSVRVKQKT